MIVLYFLRTLQKKRVRILHNIFKYIAGFASGFFLFSVWSDYYSSFTSLHIILFYAVLSLLGLSFFLFYYPDTKYTKVIIGLTFFGSLGLWLYFTHMYEVGMVAIGGGLLGALQKNSDEKHKKVQEDNQQVDFQLGELAREVNKQAQQLQAIERKKQIIDMNIGKQSLSTNERIQRDILISKPVASMSEQEVEDFLSLVLADNGHYDPEQANRIQAKLKEIDKQLEELE